MNQETKISGFDLSTLSRDDLNELSRKIEAELKKRNESARKQALSEARKAAQMHGFRLEELLSEVEPGEERVRRVVAPKYRHPQQADWVWTGRGLKPRWVRDWEAAGHSLAELEISRP